MKKAANKNKRKRAAAVSSQIFTNGKLPVKGIKENPFYIVGMGGGGCPGGLGGFAHFLTN
jgi:hypothetical protein